MGGNVIVMEPSTGNILAMATYPDYNPNEPFIPNDATLEQWYHAEPEKRNQLLYEMWRNTAVQSTFEPGSTFKFITAAAALEEGVATMHAPGVFFCSGTERSSNVEISCWRRHNPHGHQSLNEAFAGSCNPAFIQLGRKIGARTLYDYFEAFGFFDRTGASLYAESNSVFHNIDTIVDVELATMSFGQRLDITPLQLITAISAIANDGVLMQPNIVDRVRDTNTNVVTVTDPIEVRQVLSSRTAELLMEMSEYTITDGTGSRASVPGFVVGGKSGTSEPPVGREEEGFIASFVGLSPVIDTELVVLVIIYNPTAGNHHGGQVAGPVVSQILSDILIYRGSSTNVTMGAPQTTNALARELTILPDVRNRTIAEARRLLPSFTVHVYGEEDEDTTIVTDQLPHPGVNLFGGANIFLSTENNNTRMSETVPNLRGMSLTQARNALASRNLNITFTGQGVVMHQEPPLGSNVPQGTVVNVRLMPQTEVY